MENGIGIYTEICNDLCTAFESETGTMYFQMLVTCVLRNSGTTFLIFLVSLKVVLQFLPLLLIPCQRKLV